MSNGCICCTIREDLHHAAGPGPEEAQGRDGFDRVVIETTGLADPGPVAQTFFMDDEIAETYLLDSILTLVDAKHAAQQLNDRQEARRQVGFADQIFISKTDLVALDETDALMHRLKHMNPRAPQRGAFLAMWRRTCCSTCGVQPEREARHRPRDFRRTTMTTGMVTTITTTTTPTVSTATIRRTPTKAMATTITMTTM